MCVCVSLYERVSAGTDCSLHRNYPQFSLPLIVYHPNFLSTAHTHTHHTHSQYQKTKKRQQKLEKQQQKEAEKENARKVKYLQ